MQPTDTGAVRLAVVGLGANLGDASATLRSACEALAARPGLVDEASGPLRCSGFWTTAPVDAAGPDFVNAVAAFPTRQAPLAVLDALQAVEHAFGRQRPYRNAPRTLDLDLLLLGDLLLELPRLSLPHPRALERAFVLAPLCQLLPGLRWPGRRGDDADPSDPAVWLSRVTDQAIRPMV